jgi:hypothetical protein
MIVIYATKLIEILLDTPLDDYRKEAIRLIIAPYLINIKKLAYIWATSIDEIKIGTNTTVL